MRTHVKHLLSDWSQRSPDSRCDLFIAQGFNAQSQSQLRSSDGGEIHTEVKNDAILLLADKPPKEKWS